MKRIAVAAIVGLAVLSGGRAGGLEPVPKATSEAERAEKAFQDAVRSADVAGVAVVGSAIVTQDPMRWYPPSWTETVRLARQGVMIGSPPAELTVRLHASPYRGLNEPAARFEAGQKVLFAGIVANGKFRGTPALKPFSAEAEKAVRNALTPGWMFHRDAVLCPWCRDKRHRRDAGLCETCGRKTGSGDFALCPTCAAEAGTCQRCKRRIGPPSAGVTLRLGFADPRTKRRQSPDFDTKTNLLVGDLLWVWVSVNLHTKSTAAEVRCVGGNLATSPDLLFIIEPSEPNRATVLTPPPKETVGGLEPLANPGEHDRSVAARIRVQGRGGLWLEAGTYTLRAAVGRLVSNPVTVVVEKKQAATRPALPAVAVGGMILRWAPGGPTVSAERNGKILWRVKLAMRIGNIVDMGDGTLLIQSTDGSREAGIHAATGRMLWMKQR